MKKFLLTPDTYAYNGSNADPADLESVRQHWAPGTLNKLGESKMKITKRQLRRIIQEERATVMGMTGRSDELFDARDNLLGLIEMLEPEEFNSYIDSLIRELEMMKRGV